MTRCRDELGKNSSSSCAVCRCCFTGRFGFHRHLSRAVLVASDATPSFSSIDDLADEGGAGAGLRKYLAARGIKAVATLALIAKADTELQ